jgi:hypothetical protein
MEKIHDICDNFDFSKLKISNPISKPGGFYLLKYSVDNGNSLYIQPHKCKTKNGIIKGKKTYTDLMFNSDNPELMTWLEKLEIHSQNFIYEKRDEYFEGGLELDDIESYFIPPVKLYKSGKYYLVRAFMPTIMGKPALKIYDEAENEVSIDSIDNNTDLTTILEFKGIKCSAKSFQIEVEIKQMMKMEPLQLFTKCIIKPNKIKNNDNDTDTDTNIQNEKVISLINDNHEEEDVNEVEDVVKEIDEVLINEEIITNHKENNNDNKLEEITNINKKDENNLGNSNNEILNIDTDTSIMEEITLDPNILESSEIMEIKEANEVYYKMYKEAMKRARLARDLALNSYLEAKNIKNKHMLDESLLDSDESDLEKELEINED